MTNIEQFWSIAQRLGDEVTLDHETYERGAGFTVLMLAGEELTSRSYASCTLEQACGAFLLEHSVFLNQALAGQGQPGFTLVQDYEACGGCGFDHAYEPAESQSAHVSELQ